MTITKPMLAGTPKGGLDRLSYPIIASPKLDGIRCLKVNGAVVTRTFKPIRNNYIRRILEEILPEGADGEIMAGNNFQQVSSAVMSEAGEPAFAYWMFDLAPLGARSPDYSRRLQMMQKVSSHTNLVVVPHRHIITPQELGEYEEECLAQGYEGVMVRTPNSPYKCGRATAREGYLLKIKRFVDSEARILSFEEQMKNTNAAERDAFGRTKRSSAKEGMVGKNTLGKFIVEEVGDAPWTKPFRIGMGEGLTDALRQQIWDNQEEYLGQIVKYRYQPHGVKDAPRLPTFLGFRDPEDR
jgi:DNA ligase-1